MKKLFIRKNDTVVVIAGKDKGKQGKVLDVDTKTGRLTIEGVNVIKRHVKASQKNPQGGVISKEAAIHYSNAMLLDPTSKKPLRAAKFKRDDKGNVSLKK